MNKLKLLLVLLSPMAFGHGTVADQASDAIKSALEVFEHAQPKEIVKQLLEVRATHTGHEKFDVVITLQNESAKFQYACYEDETEEPIEWVCTNRN